MQYMAYGPSTVCKLQVYPLRIFYMVGSDSVLVPRSSSTPVPFPFEPLKRTDYRYALTAFWGTQSVDTMLKLDEETLISGASDGVIRLVGILPNRIIQPLAEHSEYPVEALAFSNDRKYLGSISHDKLLKDLQELLSGPQLVHDNELAESDGDDSDDDEMDVDMEPSSSKGLVSSFDCHCSLDVFH